ncbi:class I adenylate-forming enzyme family protein [Novosphingobium sp.]|uniref:class I adenylate-forming enzyme family protein n=1 Tax=Novosphingobium sp. TaxID=1874826 RepID=UPI0038B8E3C5
MTEAVQKAGSQFALGLVDPVLAEIAKQGSIFEMGVIDGMRQFVRAPANLHQMIEGARRFGDQTCVVDFDGDRTERRLTFAQVFARRDQLAAHLRIAPGERVAICMRNRAEWLIGYLAVIAAGGVAVLLNSRAAGPELLAMLEDADPAIALVDGPAAQALDAAGYSGRTLDLTAASDPDDAAPASAATASGGAAARADDPCSILFTSGTTGRAKGAVLGHRNLITGLMSTQLAGAMVLHNMASQYGMTAEALLAGMPQQAALLVFPLFHVSGLGSGFLSPFLAGSKIVIMRRWDATVAVRLIAEEGVTMFSGVPTMLWDIVHRAKLVAGDLANLRNIGCGGQALPVNLIDAIHAACPQAQIGTGYGMTECSGAIAQAVGPDFLRRPASAGRVLPLVDVRIIAADGENQPAGGVGEIVVRGPQVMQGYWNRPEDTAAVLSPDGWLRTGDIGMVDADGYVFIVDRKKDMVISGGENIYCAEVERVIGEIAGVHECAAFGLPDDRLGERLVAVVVADGLHEAAIVDHVAERLARYKAPHRVAISRQTLPRNALGKADKIALRQAWNSLLGEQ